ncbi:hypothetical protein HDV00_001409 [Rhizophlyctis rosea]|nr:hypothetical protein HDV00_001409 [Rhizophlyctis rosea]
MKHPRKGIRLMWVQKKEKRGVNQGQEGMNVSSEGNTLTGLLNGIVASSKASSQPQSAPTNNSAPDTPSAPSIPKLNRTDEPLEEPLIFDIRSGMIYF